MQADDAKGFGTVDPLDIGYGLVVTAHKHSSSPARAASTSKLLVMTGPTRCPASFSSLSAHMAGVGSARKHARNISTNSAAFSSGSVSSS